MTGLYAIITFLSICVVLESAFELKFVKRIILTLTLSFLVSYLISPVIPFGTDIDKLLSSSYYNTAANSLFSFIIVFLIITMMIMALSIFFDKIVEFILNIFSALFISGIIFVFVAALHNFNTVSSTLEQFMENQDIKLLSSLIDCLTFNTDFLIIPSVIAFILLVAAFVSFFKSRKIYDYISLSYFSGFIGSICAVSTVICVIISTKKDVVILFSEISDISAIISLVSDIKFYVLLCSFIIPLYAILSVIIRIMVHLKLREKKKL